MEAKVVVLLDVVEVAVDEEAVVGELVVVHDVLLIYLVDNIGVFKVQKSWSSIQVRNWIVNISDRSSLSQVHK